MPVAKWVRFDIFCLQNRWEVSHFVHLGNSIVLTVGYDSVLIFYRMPVDFFNLNLSEREHG